jgi:hypothetical protein
MCETIIFFGLAVMAGLLLWVVRLDNQLEDYRSGVRK